LRSVTGYASSRDCARPSVPDVGADYHPTRAARVGTPGNKRVALVRFADGTIHRVELHWYEAHGIGRKKLKIKEYLD